MEIWKQIKGYEGLYEVSNLGRVKSLCAGRWGYEMIRKPVKDKDGYLTVNLKKDGKYECAKIHRLVASAFVPNPNDFPQVNHRDENKQNNSAENLEWCTAKYNNTYNNKHHKYFKPIIQKNLDGTEVKRYKSVNDASEETGISAACISGVLSGRRRKTGGYLWAYQL